MSYPINIVELVRSTNMNEYEIVNLINNRVRELMNGAKPLIDDKKDSFIEIAISEFLSGKIKPRIC